MSTVTLTEVSWALAADLGMAASRPNVADLLELVELEAPTAAIAEVAARLKRGWYLSLGDSHAAALALSLAAPVWSGDPELLTKDRVWLAHDLRSDELARQHAAKVASGARRIGRRLAADNDLSRLDLDEIAAHVVEPLT